MANGIISSIARNGKAFRLEGESPDTWYSCFDIKNMGQAAVGADVQFKFTTKNGEGGKVWNNVQGPVQVINPGPEGATAPALRAVSTPAVQTFGAVTLTRDRSIARQNACNVMASILGRQLAIDPNHLDGDEVRRIADLVLAGAEIIEAYTTGDDDKEEAEEKMRVKSAVPKEQNDLLDEFDEAS